MNRHSNWRPNMPSDRAQIWRYMSLAKYISLLATNALFFCRADKLGDPFEGAIGKSTHAPAYTPPTSFRNNTAPREKFYISSWHIQRHELAAMWKTYGGLGESVAIRTNCGKLREALPDHIIIGKVEYIEFQDQNPRLKESELRRYFTKRRSFKTDCELRAVDNRDLGRKRSGVLHKVKLKELITHAYVSPQTPNWYLEAVRDVTARFDLPFKVYKSPLDSGALF